MHACMRVCIHAYMHVCLYACMRVCMYACMHVVEAKVEACSFWEPTEQLLTAGPGVALQDFPDGLMGKAREHFEMRQLSEAWHQWRCYTLVRQICDAWAKIGVSKTTSEVWRLTGADLTKPQVALVEVLRRVAKDLGWYKLLDYG